jgi:two-component sensor histidine kinase/ActR/RegA family two-component response regulator
MEEKESILIIDDDESTCKSLSLIFRKKNYEIETAGTGEEAIEKARERFFNMALLDIKLPDMEGVELLAPLKEMHPDMVIIMVTAYASMETAVRALNEGASFYIIKPLNMDEVLSTIREVLEKQKLVIENRRLLQEVQRELAERKRAEEELRRHRDLLEEMVKERTAKLEEANDELQREINERKRAEKQIKASLAEKELLLKEIHHRVKNNMQIISSLLNIQLIHIKDHLVRKTFMETQNRIKSMAMIHEKLYRSENLTRIDFAEYIESLTADLFQAFNVNPDNVTLKKNVKNVYLDVSIGIPCGLIINELVSNSLKYAFPEGQPGEIIIDFKLKNNTYELTVGDNGIGFPKYLDFRSSESFGLQLVRLLVKKIEGTIELDKKRGIIFKIVFKGNGNYE